MSRQENRDRKKKHEDQKNHKTAEADFLNESNHSIFNVRPPHKEDWPEKMTKAVGSTTSLYLHTLAFVIAFILPFFGIDFDRVLLVLTTVVSLEAIYLALFIQMTVNRNTESLADVEEEIDEIQEDIEEISDDIDEISDDIDEISDDIDEIQEDVEEINEDIGDKSN